MDEARLNEMIGHDAGSRVKGQQTLDQSKG